MPLLTSKAANSQQSFEKWFSAKWRVPRSRLYTPQITSQESVGPKEEARFFMCDCRGWDGKEWGRSDNYARLAYANWHWDSTFKTRLHVQFPIIYMPKTRAQTFANTLLDNYYSIPRETERPLVSRGIPDDFMSGVKKHLLTTWRKLCCLIYGLQFHLRLAISNFPSI